LGYTDKPNPYNYKGSGKHWKRHINKHGYDVATTILYETPFIEEIKEMGLYYSDLWNVVGSKEFANMVKETGTGISGDDARSRSRAKLLKLIDYCLL